MCLACMCVRLEPASSEAGRDVGYVKVLQSMTVGGVGVDWEFNLKKFFFEIGWVKPGERSRTF